MRIPFLVAFYVLTTDCFSQAVGTEFFGMHNADFSLRTQHIPFSTIRLWDCGVCWNQLETSKNTWDFQRFDQLVAFATINNVELAYVLGQTPAWASSNPLDSTGVYGMGANQVPETIDLWENYVRTVAERYRGKIRYYEVWNEPNFPIFFNGTIGQMSELTKSASSVLKKIDSTIQLISPGIIAGTFEWLPQHNSGKEWLQNFIKLTPAENFDIIGAHFYTPEKASPERELIPMIRDFKLLLKQQQIDKPVWNTEQGYGAMDPARRVTYRGDTAIGIAVRTYLINLMQGVQRVYWYNWSNRDFCSLYLVEEDLVTPTAAANAIALIREWLVGKKILHTECVDQSVYVMQLEDELNNKFAVVWSDVYKNVTHLNFEEIKSIEAVNAKAVEFSSAGFSISQLPVLVTFK
jgi:hypothetical protein